MARIEAEDGGGGGGENSDKDRNDRSSWTPQITPLPTNAQFSCFPSPDGTVPPSPRKTARHRVRPHGVPKTRLEATM